MTYDSEKDIAAVSEEENAILCQRLNSMWRAVTELFVPLSTAVPEKTKYQYPGTKAKLEDDGQQNREITTSKNNILSWDIGVMGGSTISGALLSAAIGFCVIRETLAFWLSFVCGLSFLLLAILSIILGRRAQSGRANRATSELRRRARIELFREKYSNVTTLYRLQSTLNRYEIKWKALHEAFAHAPLETGEEMREALSGVSPTIHQSVEGWPFQGLLNFCYISQEHGHDLSVIHPDTLKLVREIQDIRAGRAE